MTEHLTGRPDATHPSLPAHLPRQRRGITPQMHGRYPDYDVLESAPHWDEATRRVVLARVGDPPPIRFFTPIEVDCLRAFCDLALAQDVEPRVPVLEAVDAKLAAGQLDGYQYADMPDDRETWRLVARGLDESARARGADSFARAPQSDQLAMVDAFAHGGLEGGAWGALNVSRAWTVVMRAVLAAFYAHPWTWSEIGFGGPAYPRGYMRMGIGLSEPHEAPEAYGPDPVPDVAARERQ